jgi:DNA-binding response OmpR family regulator
MEGYEVKCSDHGHGLYDTVASYRPDVILLDIMLGDLDGRELCKHLKGNPQTKHIPIIMISASHTLYNLSEKDSLADDFIAKPFDINNLADKVRQYIN